MVTFGSWSRLIMIFTLLLGAVLNAQNEIDSLKRIIANEKIHDTTKLATISLLLDNVYENEDFDNYNALMGKIAKKNADQHQNNAELKTLYTDYLGAYYSNLGVRDEENGVKNPFINIDKSIKVYQSINALPSVNILLVTKGIMLYRRKQYKEAIDCYFEALKYFEAHKKENIDNLSYLYMNLGVVYMEQGLKEESLKWYNKSLDYFEIKGDDLTIDQELNKCNLYQNLGSLYSTLNQFDKARDYYTKSIDIAKKHQSNDMVSFSLGRLAVIDMHFKKYDEAEQQLIEAAKLSDYPFYKSFALINLGEVYYKKQEYEKAEIALKDGLAWNESIKNSKLNKQAYELLLEVFKTIGKYKEALIVHEKLVDLNDENLQLEAKNELKQQELKYDYEKKVLQLQLLAERKTAAKNNLLIGLSSLFVLLLLAGYFLYRNAKQKQAISTFEKNELKQKLLLTQMNPHFIFNSIDTIQSLIYAKQEKEAITYLSKFSKLTRQILENSTENYITLEEELTMLDNYLNIQQLLYDNKFNFAIKYDPSLETESILVPPMIAQPFIENAIKHGLRNKTNQGQITVIFEMTNNKLLFTVIDNGEGFGEIEQDHTKKSMAMAITKERLKSIAKNTVTEVHTENILDSNATNVGAKVFFEIPYLYEN